METLKNINLKQKHNLFDKFIYNLYLAYKNIKRK